MQHTISDEGVDAYVELAEEHHLLEHRTYEGNDMIADAAATVVRIRIDGEEYVHSAYALGFEDETDPDRAELQDFVERALDPAALVGDAPRGGGAVRDGLVPRDGVRVRPLDGGGD